MSDTVNDYIYAALSSTYGDVVSAMVILWREDNSIATWADYVDHVRTETGISHFADAEYAFWRDYTGGGSGPALGDGYLLESGDFMLLESGDYMLLEA